MLVLTRKTSETIVIDGQITITILRIKGGATRVGIEAPSHVTIRRGELTPFLAEQLAEPLIEQGGDGENPEGEALSDVA